MNKKPDSERKVGFGREKRPIEREKRASGAEFRACEVGFQIAKTLRFLAYFIGDTKGSESLFAMLNGGVNGTHTGISLNKKHTR